MKKLLVACLLLAAGIALAQTPAVLWGSIYNAVVPTYANLQTAIWQGGANGYLRVQGLVVGPPQFLLMTNGTAFVLQTNAVAKICLAGTC